MDPLLEVLQKGGPAAVLAVFALLLWRRMEKRDDERRQDDKERYTAITEELKLQTGILRQLVERSSLTYAKVHQLAGGRGRVKTPTPFWPIEPTTSAGKKEDDE